MPTHMDVEDGYGVMGEDITMVSQCRDETPQNITPTSAKKTLLDSLGGELISAETVTPASPMNIGIDAADLSLQSGEVLVRKKIEGDLYLNMVKRTFILSGTYPSSFGGTKTYKDVVEFYMAIIE